MDTKAATKRVEIEQFLLGKFTFFPLQRKKFCKTINELKKVLKIKFALFLHLNRLSASFSAQPLPFGYNFLQRKKICKTNKTNELKKCFEKQKLLH